jgi:hypothetical protein
VSGYLRNLARRALCRTAVLHSVATLPFATVPSMPLQEEESRVGLRPPARSPDSAGTGGQVGNGTASRSAREEGARAHRAPERAAGRRQLPEPLVPSAGDPPVRPPPARRVAASAGKMPPTTGGIADESGRATTSDAAHEVAREASSWRPQTALPQASAVPVIAVPSRRSAPPEATARPRAVRMADTATEVHLSIGRVEVAVLAKSPASKEGRPRIDRTMSLAEYERRRRERDR